MPIISSLPGRAALASAAAIALAACGGGGGAGGDADTTATTAPVITEAMPAEEMGEDMMMDGSAMDAVADMAPPADPMMEMPGEEQPAG